MQLSLLVTKLGIVTIQLLGPMLVPRNLRSQFSLGNVTTDFPSAGSTSIKVEQVTQRYEDTHRQGHDNDMNDNTGCLSQELSSTGFALNIKIDTDSWQPLVAGTSSTHIHRSHQHVMLRPHAHSSSWHHSLRCPLPQPDSYCCHEPSPKHTRLTRSCHVSLAVQIHTVESARVWRQRIKKIYNERNKKIHQISVTRQEAQTNMLTDWPSFTHDQKFYTLFYLSPLFVLPAPLFSCITPQSLKSSAVSTPPIQTLSPPLQRLIRYKVQADLPGSGPVAS